MRVQLVLFDTEIEKIDEYSKAEGINRSEFVRRIIDRDLRTRRIREMEEQCIRSYEKFPQELDDLEVWDEVQGWFEK